MYQVWKACDENCSIWGSLKNFNLARTDAQTHRHTDTHTDTSNTRCPRYLYRGHKYAIHTKVYMSL
jgi:hypothetical protein